jgi:hypothetical protein
MHTPSGPYPFLQKFTADPKAKFRASIEEISEAVEQQGQLRTIHERGLFMVVVAELVSQQFSICHIRVKNLQAEVCKVHKPAQRRRLEGERNPPRRHRRARDNADNVDLQQIASDSVSNPSHLQAERKPGSEDSQNGSKGSKPSNPQSEPNIDFRAQLENLGPIEVNPIDDVEHELMNPDSSQNSSYSGSTSGSSNGISNFTEKLKIIGSDFSYEMDKRTVPKRRNVRPAGATIKRRDALIDFSTILDESTMGLDPRNLP